MVAVERNLHERAGDVKPDPAPVVGEERRPADVFRSRDFVFVELGERPSIQLENPIVAGAVDQRITVGRDADKRATCACQYLRAAERVLESSHLERQRLRR